MALSVSGSSGSELTRRSPAWRLRAVVEALALVGLSSAVLDGNGRVRAANGLTEAPGRHVRWLPGDRLALIDPHANALLRRSLGGDSGGMTVRSFASRVASGDAAVIHLIPGARQTRSSFDGGLAVLIIMPVTASAGPDIGVMRALFRLSAAEARVAHGLTSGRSIAEIAASGGVSRETVRSQIKAVMAKTGIKRQAALTALLAAIPKLPQGPIQPQN